MSDLIQAVTNGKIEQTTSSSSSKSSSNELGKDAFLQLLCTQMQYQDPLNPSTDTEYVSQLATFSQLEQMQNISAVTTSSQALSLVGKNVVVQSESASGKVTYLSGTVDFVKISGTDTKLSIDGTMYDMDQLYSVVDENYLISQGLPSIKDTYDLTYKLSEPSDLEFEVDLGSGDTTADNVAIIFNGTVLDNKYVSIDKNKVTISKEALAESGIGKYKLSVVFNDTYYTTISDKVSVLVVKE